MAAIEVRGLCKSFGKVDVLRGIDFDVQAGSVFGYIGANGAGKTTTVRILTGQESAFEGDVRVAGIDVREDPRAVKECIGYVAESAKLYDGLSALEYVQLIGRLRQLGDSTIDRRGKQLLEIFDLGPRMHNRLSTFSKGMKQKVMFCCGLLHDPQVLFLDEPLSGLDVETTIFIKELLRALSAEGRTIFYCSHMMDVVERVCDRIVILNEGEAVANGSFEELSERSSEASLEGLFSSVTGARGAEARVSDLLAVLRD